MSLAHPQPDPGAGTAWPALDGLARVHGDAFFVFDGAELRANVSALRTAMAAAAPDVELAYSIKANYTPAVCRLTQSLGMLVEVSSPMELWFAGRLGIPGPRIVYNGPGKSTESVRDALLAGALVNLETDLDVEWALATAREHPRRRFGVGLRCSLAGPQAGVSRLGFDAAGETLGAVAEGLRPGVARWARHPRIIVEPGAAVVSSAFCLYARVLEVKTVQGQDFALVAASVLDTSPNLRRIDFPVTVISREVSAEAAGKAPILVGGMTPIDGDYLALDLLARPAVGDFVRFDNVGAYSISMRPAFNYPPHAILQTDGEEVTVLRPRQSFEDVLRGFV